MSASNPTIDETEGGNRFVGVNEHDRPWLPEPFPEEAFDQQESILPTDSQVRKEIPLVRGVLDYFPNALIEVARVSEQGNRQHNPGQPLHWSRDKSTDHADTIVRHLVDRGKLDADGQRHSAKVAWRALALLEEELEAEGAVPGRGSVFQEGQR